MRKIVLILAETFHFDVLLFKESNDNLTEFL